MNAPMKKQVGPVMYLVDSDPALKAATCVGCKFADIYESHFVFCAIQNSDGSNRMPPMIRNYDNKGKQVLNGAPNKFCPYIHRAETYKAGRRVPRTFEQMLRDLSYERGWVEECPDANRWYFRKKHWLVTVHWLGKSITFQNLRRPAV